MTSNGREKPCAIEVEALTKRFGDFTAVDAVTFHLEEGEIFGFLGPNGSGKTTTIRMLCGLMEPTTGTGRVLGLDIRTQPDQVKARIGYMAQKFALYDDLTAAENLGFYASVYGVPRKEAPGRVSELIAMAGLTGREGERVSTLSGAWKQRLALGCAIVHKPDVLFLDEPTAGVDPVSRRHFWELIYTLAGRGVTVFVTTHYMDEAERCNRVALMYNGRLVACDEPDLLKARLSGTLLEIEAEPLVEAMDVVRAYPGVQEVVAHGLLIHATLAPAADILGAAGGMQIHASFGVAAAGETADAADRVRNGLAAALARRAVTVSSIQIIEPSLEDVFISMIDVERRAAARAALAKGRETK